MSSIKERYTEYQNKHADLQNAVNTAKAQFLEEQLVVHAPAIMNSGLKYRVNDDGVLELAKKLFPDLDGGFGDHYYAPVDKEGLEVDIFDPRVDSFNNSKTAWQMIVGRAQDALLKYERENINLVNAVRDVELKTTALLKEHDNNHDQAIGVIQAQLKNISGLIVLEDSSSLEGEKLRVHKAIGEYALNFLNELKGPDLNATTPTNGGTLSV